MSAPRTGHEAAPSLPRVERLRSFWAWVKLLGLGHDNHAEPFEHVSRMTTVSARNPRNQLHSLTRDDGTQDATGWFITRRPQ